jgi:hypothetical protein
MEACKQYLFNRTVSMYLFDDLQMESEFSEITRSSVVTKKTIRAIVPRLTVVSNPSNAHSVHNFVDDILLTTGCFVDLIFT